MLLITRSFKIYFKITEKKKYISLQYKQLID